MKYKKFTDLKQLDRIEFMLAERRLNRRCFTLIDSADLIIKMIWYYLVGIAFGLLCYLATDSVGYLIIIQKFFFFYFLILTPVLITVGVLGSIDYIKKYQSLKEFFKLR